jgi:hypothetical protein
LPHARTIREYLPPWPSVVEFDLAGKFAAKFSIVRGTGPPRDMHDTSIFFEVVPIPGGTLRVEPTFRKAFHPDSIKLRHPRQGLRIGLGTYHGALQRFPGAWHSVGRVTLSSSESHDGLEHIANMLDDSWGVCLIVLTARSAELDEGGIGDMVT